MGFRSPFHWPVLCASSPLFGCFCQRRWGVAEGLLSRSWCPQPEYLTCLIPPPGRSGRLPAFAAWLSGFCSVVSSYHRPSGGFHLWRLVCVLMPISRWGSPLYRCHMEGKYICIGTFNNKASQRDIKAIRQDIKDNIKRQWKVRQKHHTACGESVLFCFRLYRHIYNM